MLLTPDEIHLWFSRLDLSPDEVTKRAEILSADEIARANRYHFDRDRRRFMVARSCLRQVLGDYLEISPEKIEFEYSLRGKPSLKNNVLQFNVSHSGEMALCGLSRERRIGVDLEYIRSITDLESLTKRFFCDKEYELIKTIPAKEKAEVFFQLWTAKEAYLKAIGTGISGGLDRVEVSVDPLQLNDIEGDWHLWSCQLEENYRATVAIEGQNWQVRIFS